MRKLYAMILVLFCATILSGCIRFTTTVKIKSNGKADISMLYAVSKDLAEMGDEDISAAMSEDQVADMEEDGWECIPYNKDEYVGYEMIKRDVDLVELASEYEDSEDSTAINMDQLSVQRKGLTYIIDWKMFEDEQAAQMKEYKKYFDTFGGYMSFVLELPIKASSSNATYVSEDGKRLEWDLLAAPEEGIHVEFSLLNVPLIIGCIVAAVFLVVVVIVIIIAVVANQKKKKMYAQQMEFAGNAMPVQGSDSVADEIMKLKNLMDDGVITAEEFEAQKRKLLGE